ncbi:DUF6090 family protein [Muriicola sp. Z0-33]|uniref:DUF6090 family protein n=1 Tax=Muriicola sp. Z0-33 TaxID=2816957 RepID=UPI0022383654|nr:DUF6090 family protein [Muriicola sp. Z0-33]MCW5515442.1 hypothetical protein [Muriicola sp. Z0-33]
MLKFFRRIRQQLLTENKFSKYLLYAIGEIFLVLIGILLALSISDWNNERIEKQSEIKTLSEIKKGVLVDLDLIIAGQLHVNNSISDIKHLQSLLENKDYEYTKELDTLFGVIYGMRLLQPNSAFYEDLKSAGLDLIKDENIRFQIVQLFESNYKMLNWINELEMSINEVNRSYYLNNFNHPTFSKFATPNDFKFIWNDSYYHNVIDYRLLTLNNQVVNYEKASTSIKALVSAIDNYIEE